MLLAVVGGVLGVTLRGSGASHPPAQPSAAAASSLEAGEPPNGETIQAERRVRGSHDAPVPILMYHVVAPPVAGAPYPDLYVLPSDFRAQMRWLARHGYHGVTLDQVYRYWHDGVALPKRPIVISFDDGYRSHFVNAFPVLRALHWPAVVSIAVKNMEESWGLSPRMVRVLVEAGWEIDSHTLTHADLTALAPADLEREVARSRKMLQREFGVPVDFFCYPSGRYDDTVVTAVRKAGYLGATTTRFGLGRPSELFTLARARISGSDGVTGFAAKVTALQR